MIDAFYLWEIYYLFELFQLIEFVNSSFTDLLITKSCNYEIQVHITES